ncbi:MAG: glycoside hydrolase family 88 protein [Acidobacteria bacterium]|nr:glycoside hydrolase family 88 protein [Acidobacteriota bacterium]
MRLSAFLPVALLVPLACRQAPEPPPEPQVVARVEVSNPSSFTRPDTLVTFTLDELGVTDGPLQVWQGEAPRPTQLLDDDGDGHPDRLAFLADLGPAETVDYVIDRRASEEMPAPRTHAEVSIKEGGEWQGKTYVGGTFKDVEHVTAPPQCTDHSEYIRYEGPGIESDWVGYRIYLDWRNGFDIFGKKTAEPVLQNVGLDGYDSYHEMSDWGADILKVGESLGIGGFGTWDGTKTVLVSDVQERSTTIRADGPIYSAFEIEYKGWNTGTATVDLIADFSMHAGSPMVDVSLWTSEPLDNLAIGLVAHPDTEVLSGDLDITGQAWSYLATWGKQSLFGDDLGMVVLFKKIDFIEQTRDEASQVVVLRPRGKELSYAFGALWSGQGGGAGQQPGGVHTREELETFLKEEVERRTIPPRIRLETEASKVAQSLTPLQVSTQLAVTELARRGDSLADGGWDTMTSQPASWNYTTGLLAQAMDDLSTATGDQGYADWAQRTIGSYVADDGTIHTYDAGDYNIDQINSGKMLLRLYERTGDERYRKAINALAEQLAHHPRTSEGAFWHKQRYPHQLWLDGIYMGMPFLAGVGVLEGDEHKIEEAAREFSIAREHLRDPETGLYFHAWDEAKEQGWADPETGRSRYVWGRGLGWFAMALVDILDVIPEDRTEVRAPLVAMIPELAESLVRTQDETGVWFQIVDMPDEPGNYREASASAMFTYFLAKGVNQGYLPDTYAAAAKKAYAGLVAEFVSVHADGSYHLTNNCEVGGLGYGRDGSYRYYMSERVVEDDPKALGPAIMAGIQAEKLEA